MGKRGDFVNLLEIFLYIAYMFQCFETWEKRGDFFNLLEIFLYHRLYVSMFQFVAKHMETH